MGEEFISLKPLFIASCDHQTIYDRSEWDKIYTDESIDGAVWTFNLKGTLYKDPKAFAYCNPSCEHPFLYSREKQSVSKT